MFVVVVGCAVAVAVVVVDLLYLFGKDASSPYSQATVLRTSRKNIRP